MPWRRAIAMISSIAQGSPAKSTGMTTFVCGVMARSNASGSMFASPSRTSTRTGVAPQWTATLAVAENV